MTSSNITLGGRQLKLRPLTLRQIRDLAADIEAGGRCGPRAAPEEVDAFCRVLAAGLAENDDITADALLDLVDLGDIAPVWASLMGISGFVAKSGEA